MVSDVACLQDRFPIPDSRDIQNYWVFGLFPLSDNLENRKPNVSETGSVSVLKGGGETPEGGNRSSFRNIVFSLF
jgi:hypothetical protein